MSSLLRFPTVFFIVIVCVSQGVSVFGCNNLCIKSCDDDSLTARPCVSKITCCDSNDGSVTTYTTYRDSPTNPFSIFFFFFMILAIASCCSCCKRHCRGTSHPQLPPTAVLAQPVVSVPSNYYNPRANPIYGRPGSNIPPYPTQFHSHMATPIATPISQSIPYPPVGLQIPMDNDLPPSYSECVGNGSKLNSS